jgi:Dolichyl-phosphate-mannose-protein mannosyltransferase
MLSSTVGLQELLASLLFVEISWKMSVAHARFCWFLSSAASCVPLAISLGAAVFLSAAFVPSMSTDIGGAEQNIVFSIERMLLNLPLYLNPDELPFIGTQYTPVYFYVVLGVCRLLGIDSGDVHRIYVIGRIVSAIATGGCCIIIFAILRRYIRLNVVVATATAGLLPLAINKWGFSTRPDPLYLLLISASLFASMVYAESQRTSRLMLASLLLVTAFYTKQTAAFMFPLPFIVGAARHGRGTLRGRDIITSFLIYGISIACVPAIMTKNFAIDLANGIDIDSAMENVYWPVAKIMAPFVCFILIGLVRQRLLAEWAVRAILLATVWFLIVGLALSVKLGSAENYLDEFVVGCLILVGMTCGATVGRPGSEFAPRYLFLTGLIIACQLNAAYRCRPAVWHAAARQDAIYDWGQVLSTDRTMSEKRIMPLDYISLVFIPGRAAFAPFEVMGTSARAGGFDIRPVIGAIRSGLICYAVADAGNLTRIWATQPPINADDAFTANLGRTILADFHVFRRYGAKVMLVSNSCS